MCGIAGIWNRDDCPVAEGAINRMKDSLLHRGPDAFGIYKLNSMALAHTRLSIIDLSSAGAQPFISADSRYVLVFNGEIYNYKELREKYLANQKFSSESDTEVLLEMLIHFGIEALQYLRGMFAFAFFDTREDRMILATDPFGKKPIYYTWVGNVFLFASEPKAILVSGYLTATLEQRIVAPYLLHEYCPSPESGFKGIYTLGAGEYMDIARDTKKIVAWWKPQLIPKHRVSFQASSLAFDELLGHAIERRMVADVPVGLFLSGGLDSSTIAWYMRRIKKEGDIHSYSVSFQDKSFNEEHIASQVASSLGLTHHSIEFTKDTFLESVREIIPLLDIPLADASLLPTYVVSKLARKQVKVVLDGDGSDELLGGYGTFNAYEVAERLRWVPKEIWKTLSYQIDHLLPVSHRYFSLDFKVKSFIRGMAYSPRRNIQVWLGAFTEQEVRSLLKPGSAIPIDTMFDFVESCVATNIHDSFDRASMYHINSYLKQDIVVKIDRATMATGLEARTPFLDTDLVSYVLRLPTEHKRNKRILQELMRHRLPNFVIERKKQGFGIPISSWFADEVLFFVEDVLSLERITKVGIFNYSAVQKLINDHRKKVCDNRKKIWTLIVFQLWYEYWILGQRGMLQSGSPLQVSQ